MQWRRCDRCSRLMITGVMQHTFAECVVCGFMCHLSCTANAPNTCRLQTRTHMALVDADLLTYPVAGEVQDEHARWLRADSATVVSSVQLDFDEEKAEREALRAGVPNTMSHDPACHHWIQKRSYYPWSWHRCDFCDNRTPQRGLVRGGGKKVVCSKCGMYAHAECVVQAGTQHPCDNPFRRLLGRFPLLDAPVHSEVPVVAFLNSRSGGSNEKQTLLRKLCRLIGLRQVF